MYIPDCTTMDMKHNMGRSMEHNMGPSMKHNMGPSMKHNMGPSMKHNMGPSMEHNMGPSMKHNMGRSMEHNMGPSMEHNMGPSMKHNMGPSMEHNMGPSMKHNMGPSMEHKRFNISLNQLCRPTCKSRSYIQLIIDSKIDPQQCPLYISHKLRFVIMRKYMTNFLCHASIHTTALISHCLWYREKVICE